MNIPEMDERYLKAALEAGIAQGYESFARLRSGGERVVAIALIDDRVRHQYEKVLELSSPLPPHWRKSRKSRANWKRISSRILIPDFYLLDYNAVVEYWGVDDFYSREHTIDTEEYLARMRMKMAKYHCNNIPFLSIYPQNLRNGYHVEKIRKFVDKLKKK
jgi:hypothetical protein